MGGVRRARARGRPARPPRARDRLRHRRSRRRARRADGRTRLGGRRRAGDARRSRAARVPRASGVQGEGRAEELPFRDGWFERAVMRQVVQHVDRARALPELARVLGPGGRAVDRHLPARRTSRASGSTRSSPRSRRSTARASPSRARSPRSSRPQASPRRGSSPSSQHRELDRATALERIRGRHISTFDLIDDDELAAGTARAERELPERSSRRRSSGRSSSRTARSARRRRA